MIPRMIEEGESPHLQVGIIKWQKGFGLGELCPFLGMASCTSDEILDHFKAITIIKASGQR